MKIGFIIPPVWGIGGLERVVSCIAKHFSDQGNEIVMIFLYRRFVFPCYGKIIELNSGVCHNKIGKVYRLLQRRWKVNRILVEEHCDVIYNLFWLAPLSCYRMKMVSAIHSDPFTFNWLFKLFVRYFLSLSKVIIVPSYAIANAMKVKWGIKNVTAIYNPIDFVLIEQASNQPLEQEFMCPYILATGRLAPEKNFQLLIKAYKISKIRDKVVLVILGDGPEKGKLTELIKTEQLENRVLLLGMQSNPFVFMKNCLFFVVSSLTETFSLVLAEALACGAPVISTSWFGVVEIVKDGENGLVVKNNDIFKLAQAMDKMYFDVELREYCKMNARESVAHFAIEKIMCNYQNVFWSVVSGSNSSE